jgi:nucleoid-associated protein Lsr2
VQRYEIIAFDDLDYARGIESPADRTLTIGLGGAQYDVDLSEAHATAVEEFLAPYLRAGRKIAAPGPAHGAPGSLREARQVGREMRALAAELGDPLMWVKPNGHGGYSYSRALRDAYAVRMGAAGQPRPGVS